MNKRLLVIFLCTFLLLMPAIFSQNPYYCELPQDLTCIYYEVSKEKIIIALKNAGTQNIDNLRIDVTSCSSHTRRVGVNEEVTFELTDCNNPDPFDDKLFLNIRKGSLNYQDTGYLRAPLTEIEISSECIQGSQQIINSVDSFCNENGRWMPKSDTGTACSFSYECKNGYCQNNVCSVLAYPGSDKERIASLIQDYGVWVVLLVLFIIFIEMLFKRATGINRRTLAQSVDKPITKRFKDLVESEDGAILLNEPSKQATKETTAVFKEELQELYKPEQQITKTMRSLIEEEPPKRISSKKTTLVKIPEPFKDHENQDALPDYDIVKNKMPSKKVIPNQNKFKQLFTKPGLLFRFGQKKSQQTNVVKKKSTKDKPKESKKYKYKPKY